ncbi:anti-sigma factor [uncultured Microbacterium sp.]|uniref:anti-sigma factor n=1 Tax=uncultured Microbacterium sp. TaxID=191216 RepID=UPI0028D7747A|nr:anti-sigma factor [uncultured Microbacterium sp.]
MNEQEFAELAAGAALDALSPDDAQRYHAALVAHPEWQNIVDADAESAAFLADGAQLATPAPGIRAELLARIAATPQTGDIVDAEIAGAPMIAAPSDEVDRASVAETAAGATAPKAPAHPLRVLFALAACLALLVGVGVGAVALNDYVNRPASVVALQDIQSAEDAQQASIELADGGTATAHWSASLGTAVLVADGIDPLPEDRAYELWFVRGETPISAGVFEADGGEATAVLAGEMHEGDVIAVTVEEAGGSPTGLPTTEPVIAIPTA